MTNINDPDARKEKRRKYMLVVCYLLTEEWKTLYNREPSWCSHVVATCFQKNH